jgi:hypothetical protein
VDKNAGKKIIYDILKIHRNLRKSPEAYSILLFNILILGMVIFMEPNRYIVIAAYFFETLVIGIFNVFKMIIISFFSPIRKEKQNIVLTGGSKGSLSPMQMNLFLVVFFILHFSIFYFVQLGLLVGTAEGLDDSFPGTHSFIPNPFSFFRETLGEQGIITVFAVILMQLFVLFYSFLLKGEYKVTSCLAQAIQPYGRIILQQFVVLIGGFFIIIFQNTAVFSCILIILKTFVDIYAQQRHETNMLKRLGESYAVAGRSKP